MILNIYKEKGWTSFDVVAKVRGMLRAKYNRKNVKVGHAGTLDPLAEGVLVVLTEKDTKRQDVFMAYDKEYYAEIGFGAESDTYDTEMPLRYFDIPKDFDISKKLNELIPKYVGQIEQTVPPYSAVKVEGKTLYKEARKGRISKLPVKRVEIKKIEIKNINYEDNLWQVSLAVGCGKGVYIRSLAHDLGQELGIGGVLLKLVRTKVGPYKVEDSVKIEDLKM